MPDKLKFGDLTTGEWRTIERRREGLTQGEVAFRDMKSRTAVVRLEQDTTSLEEDQLLTMGERAMVLRDREGSTQADIAARLDVSTFWVREMEMDRQDATRLIELFGEKWK